MFGVPGALLGIYGYPLYIFQYRKLFFRIENIENEFSISIIIYGYPYSNFDYPYLIHGYP